MHKAGRGSPLLQDFRDPVLLAELSGGADIFDFDTRFLRKPSGICDEFLSKRFGEVFKIENKHALFV